MDKLQQVFDEQFSSQIQRLIEEALENLDVTTLVENTVRDKLDSGHFHTYVSDTIKQHVNAINVSDEAIDRLEKKGTNVLQQQMPRVVQSIHDRIDSVLSETVDQKLSNLTFPEASIDPKLIDTSQLKISRHNIVDFGNTAGIQDMSDQVQLTVMDDCVVVEDQVITKSIQANTLNADTVYVDTLIAKDIASDQLWVQELTDNILAQVPIPPAPPKPKDWSWEIAEVDAKIDVAIKKQGEIKELEVYGEALLSDVLYTTPGNKRVGINTMDPSDALTVWDNEVEVVVGKHKSQEGYVGTRRRQDLNLGANNKVGACIRSDGSVAIQKLELMHRTISQSQTTPGHSAKQGDIVLNSKPKVGSPMGWVCLDGIKWAKFGLIE